MLLQRPERLSASTDHRLFERLVDSDELAFQEIWTRYHQPLTTFALRYVQSRDVAVDIVQDVFIALWERREQLRVHGTLSS